MRGLGKRKVAVVRLASPLRGLNGRKPGDHVSVTPDDSGKIEVLGELVSSPPQHIAIGRRDERAGDIVVHFPRAGFLVRSV